MTYQQTTYEFSEALVNLYHQAYAANERLGIHFKAGIMTQSELEKVLQTTPTFVKVLDKQLVSSVSVRLPWSDNRSPFFLPHLGWVATNPHFQKILIVLTVFFPLVANKWRRVSLELTGDT